MALRTADDYLESLRDGRTLYYQGRKVADVTMEPDLRVAVEHAAIDYRLAADPDHREIAVVRDPLEVPCLTDKYWATFENRSGKYLARALSIARAR